MTRRIAIFTDDPGWHGKQLKRAFARRGYAANYLSLTDCRVDLGQSGGVAIPGFEHELPDGVFVRDLPIDGKQVQVRNDDGLHFTDAGNALVVEATWKVLAPDLGLS